MDEPVAADRVSLPPKRRGLRRVARSFRFALAGWTGAWRTQANLRVHVVVAGLVLVGAASLQLSSQPLTATEWALLLICIGLVIALELVNTAVEATIDLVCPEPDPLAKLAKDAAAGAVLAMAVASVGVGLLIFGPRLWQLLAG